MGTSREEPERPHCELRAQMRLVRASRSPDDISRWMPHG